MEKIILFLLHPEEDLAKNLATYFPQQLAVCKVSKFKDGEIHFENETSVRNSKCFIFQSMAEPVNDRLVETLIAIDALKRASAGEINVLVPYLAYSRQDRKAKPRQPISARLIADILQVAGANRVITFDLHAPQIEGFYSIPVDNISCMPLFIKFLYKKNKVTENTIVVSPDHGSAVRARKMAERLNRPLAIIDKRRIKENEVHSMTIIGDVTDKDCLLIDDLVDTGNTLCEAAKLLKKHGARSVCACCTHAVLSENAATNISKSAIDDFYVTNSIQKAYKFDKEHILDLSKCLAAIIECIVEGDAVTDVIDNFEL